MSSCEWLKFRGNLLTVSCTALTAGKLPAVRAVQGDCETVDWSGFMPLPSQVFAWDAATLEPGEPSGLRPARGSEMDGPGVCKICRSQNLKKILVAGMKISPRNHYKTAIELSLEAWEAASQCDSFQRPVTINVLLYKTFPWFIGCSTTLKAESSWCQLRRHWWALQFVVATGGHRSLS